ncbi:MAG: hypothetical protein ABIV47_02985 [Roseiflexaceae bacterium]
MDEQATLETAMGSLGVGLIALVLVAIPIIAFVPTMRLAVGVLLLLVGLLAWASHWAVRS